MKRNYILQTLVLLFFVFTANAQRGINYKAIIKDGEGAAIANTEVTVQFTILENETTEVYKETHTPTTDANGIVIVNIGEGTVVSGVFNDIDWGSNPHFLKTDINTGSGLTDMGTTEFKTVPYALHASSSAGGVKELNDLSDAKVSGSSIYLGNSVGATDDGSYDRNNIGLGFNTLNEITTASYNVALGRNALGHLQTGGSNIALGFESLSRILSGSDNIAMGYGSLFYNETGQNNIAIGRNALMRLSSGSYNVSIGYKNLNYDLRTGDNNIIIGYYAHVPDASGSNQIRIGNEDITYAGIQVGWTITSDRRWKENIRSLPYGLDMLMQLKPVDYTRKNNVNRTKEMGFIAQDVEKVFDKLGYTDQGILLKDDNGYLHLRYNDFIALLTKATQEQQAIINSLNSKLENQGKDIQDLKAELGQLSSFVNPIIQNEENLKVAEK